MTVFRVQDPVRPDDSADFDEGVLEAPAVLVQVIISKSKVIYPL